MRTFQVHENLQICRNTKQLVFSLIPFLSYSLWTDIFPREAHRTCVIRRVSAAFPGVWRSDALSAHLCRCLLPQRKETLSFGRFGASDQLKKCWPTFLSAGHKSACHSERGLGHRCAAAVAVHCGICSIDGGSAISRRGINNSRMKWSPFLEFDPGNQVWTCFSTFVNRASSALSVAIFLYTRFIKWNTIVANFLFFRLLRMWSTERQIIVSGTWEAAHMSADGS